MPDLTPEEAEAAEWSGRRGDFIDRSWTRASGGTAYQAGWLLVQIRSGPKETDQLVATSDHEAMTAAEFVEVTGADPEAGGFDAALAEWLVEHPVAEITLDGTDLTATDPVVAWQCDVAEYLKIPAGHQYWIGGEVLTAAGRPREIFRHRWRVLDQTAVRSSS
jgi:hypothetical protein